MHMAVKLLCAHLFKQKQGCLDRATPTLLATDLLRLCDSPTLPQTWPEGRLSCNNQHTPFLLPTPAHSPAERFPGRGWWNNKQEPWMDGGAGSWLLLCSHVSFISILGRILCLQCQIASPISLNKTVMTRCTPSPASEKGAKHGLSWPTDHWPVKAAQREGHGWSQCSCPQGAPNQGDAFFTSLSKCGPSTCYVPDTAWGTCKVVKQTEWDPLPHREYSSNG